MWERNSRCSHRSHRHASVLLPSGWLFGAGWWLLWNYWLIERLKFFLVWGKQVGTRGQLERGGSLKVRGGVMALSTGERTAGQSCMEWNYWRKPWMYLVLKSCPIFLALEVLNDLYNLLWVDRKYENWVDCFPSLPFTVSRISVVSGCDCSCSCSPP